MSEMLRYRRLMQSIRPPRGIAMFPADSDWMVAARQVVEVFSRTWGGSACAAVPVAADGTIAEVLWPLIQRFDADSWAYLLPTLRGLQLSDPKKFDAWLEDRTQQHAEAAKISKDRARAMFMDDHVLDTPLNRWTPPPALEQAILERSSPLPDLGDEWVFDALMPEQGPGRSLVDLVPLVPSSGPIWNLDLADVQPAAALVLATYFGVLTPRAATAISAAGCAIAAQAADGDALPGLLGTAWSPTVREANCPFGVSETGCSWWTRGMFAHRRAPLCLVIGEAPTDYALAMLADRLWRRSIWVPASLIRDEGNSADRVRTSLFLALQAWRHIDPNADLLVTSTSLAEAEVRTLMDRVPTQMTGEPRFHIMAPRELRRDGRQILLAAPPVVDVAQPFLGSELAGVMPAPMPSEVHSALADHYSLRWIVEVEDPGHRLPPRSQLRKGLASGGDPTYLRMRASNDGIAYESHSYGFIPSGTPLLQVFARPRLRFPDAAEVFSTLLSAAGCEMAESSAGAYARDSVSRWGTRSAFAEALRDPPQRRFLEAYLSKKDSGEDPGNYDGTRRFLSLADSTRASGEDEGAMRAMLDEYVRHRVLRRGVCLHCARCRYFAFYPLDALDDFVLCLRCRATFPFVAEAWRGSVDEPAWYYDLDEVVFQAVKANVQVPILAVEDFEPSAQSKLVLFEHEVFFHGEAPGDDKCEVDIWAIIDGRVVLGEATITDRLEKNAREEQQRLTRLARVADAVRADALLFASGTTWSDRTKDSIAQVIGDRVETVFLEHVGVVPALKSDS